MRTSATVIRTLAMAAALAATGVASAQNLGALKDMAGGGDLSSMMSGSAGNAAGVIEYCVKNNYLGGDASEMKDKLISKLGGEEKAKEDPGYLDGAKGLLTGGDGNKTDLADTGGLKKKLTEKVCKSVLEHAGSLL